MYNRYIPQSDGSYRKSTIPQNTTQSGTKGYESSAQCQQEPVRDKPCLPPSRQNTRSSDFFRQLLPKNIDTGDLLVLVLLLLIAGDCQDNKNTALLTLLLYLIL